MKDNEREKNTAELAAWQLRQKQKAEEEAQLRLQSQRDNQNKRAMTEKKWTEGSVGGTVELGK